MVDLNSFPSKFRILLNKFVFSILPVIAELNISFILIPSKLFFVYSLEDSIKSDIPSSCFCCSNI